LKINDSHIEILLPVSTFRHFLHHQHVILHWHTELHPNQTIGSPVMMPWRFSRWQPQHHKSTSGFHFGDVSLLKTSKSICMLNFDNTAQSVAEILLFLVSEQIRLPY